MQMTISLAGCLLTLPLERPETGAFFSRFAAQGDGVPVASVSEEARAFWRGLGRPEDAFGEYSLLSLPVSDALLPQRRCILHGAAFSAGGRAWAVCAPPGVGKSTILRQLQTLHPTPVGVICGDRPVLSLAEDAPWLHPSPWNGKENWYGAPAAPLGGLLLLSRGEEDRLEPCPPDQAVWPMLASLVCSYADETLLRQLADFLDTLLRRIPVLRLYDNTPDGAARLLSEAMEKERISCPTNSDPA